MWLSHVGLGLASIYTLLFLTGQLRPTLRESTRPGLFIHAARMSKAGLWIKMISAYKLMPFLLGHMF